MAPSAKPVAVLIPVVNFVVYQVLVASVRHPVHVVEAAMIGAEICTMPFKVIEQLIKHPLTDIGLERFLADWKKLQEGKK